MQYNRKEYVWYRNKEWYPVKIVDIVKDINPDDFNTVVPILKELDYPALEDEWIHTKYHCIRQEQGKEVMFKKYISKMWLKAYKKFTFEDTERINTIRKEKLKQYGKSIL